MKDKAKETRSITGLFSLPTPTWRGFYFVETKNKEKRKRKMKKILSTALALLMLFSSVFFIVSCKKDDDGIEKSFKFTVVHSDGTEKEFDVTTTKTKVGAALINEGLISGEDGQYGLYVKTVDGETLDYDMDGKYWAFYIDGEYSMTGVDMTDIEEGKTYTFKAE